MISTNFQFLFWQNIHSCADNGSIFIPTSWIIFLRGGCSPPSPFRPIARVHREWRITELFSAECGASLNSCRVATANLVLYPTIIPGISIVVNLLNECIVINLLIIGIVRGCVMCSEWYNCYISDIIVLCAMAGGGGGAGPGDCWHGDTGERGMRRRDTWLLDCCTNM